MIVEDAEFTGEKLWQLVVDIQRAVGQNSAGCTPLGKQIMRITQDISERDPWIQEKIRRIKAP